MSHIFFKKKHITAGKLSRRTLEVQLKGAVVTNFIKILTVGTAIKLSET